MPLTIPARPSLPAHAIGAAVGCAGIEQGAACDHVMAHLESFRANTVDAASVYVTISRARDHASIYTDSRAALTSALGIRDGKQTGALDER